MDGIIKDIRYSFRSLMKRPAFTALALVTLALGIGANTAIFSVINAVLLRPLPYAGEDRIVRIDETGGKGGMGVSPPNLLDFQSQNHSFENIAGYTGGSFILTGSGNPQRIQSLSVSHNLLSVLGVNPLLGRHFSADEERPGQDQVALIGYSLWQRNFGGRQNVNGQQITLDNKSYTVVGVMSAEFEFPIQPERVEVWVPLTSPEDMSGLRGAHYLDVVGRMKQNVSVAQAQADVAAIAKRISTQFPGLVSGKTTVIPLKQDIVGKVRPYLFMLGGAVVLVFLIAAANVMSLMLARAAERQKELALRTVLGANRVRQLRHFLTESLLLTSMGSAVGVLFAAWGIDLLIAIGSSSDIPRLQTARIDSSVLLFAIASFLICGTLLGLIPAWRISSSNLSATLKEGETRSATTPRQALRKALVVTEMTLALVLLCGAGLLIKTLTKLNAVDPGFDPSRVLVAELVLPNSKYPNDARRSAFFQQLLERVKALPDVAAAGGTSNLPLSGTNMVFMAAVEGRAGSSLPAGFRAVTADYFHTMRIPVLKGRTFDDRDTATSQSVVLINKTMARQLWPSEEPLGKRIKHGFKNQIAEVVGVVDDIKYAGLDQESKPEMYAPFAQRPFPFLRVVVRTNSDPTNLIESIRQQVQSIDKDQPIDKVTTMSAIVSQSIAARRFYMQLLGIFAGVAFILASVGIYGIVSYSVSQRTREIGIRLALGADRSHVLKLVLGEGLRLAVIGVGLGLLGAFAATRVLTSLLFQVKPTDPMTFIGLSLLLALVALFASYVPARRATKVDPLVALRDE